MKTKSENGFIVGSLLVIIFIVSILLITVTSTTISNFQSATLEQYRVSGQFTADAGLDLGLHELNLDETWAGTGGEVDFYTTSTGKSIRATYEVSIGPGSADNRRNITSTARIYSPASETTPKVTRTYQLEAQAVTSGTGPGSVISGVGGLILENNAKITGGDVIVNGTAVISNGAQIGLSTNPINLRVAYQSCPVPVNATYPQVCTTGEPITNGGLIFGDVQAQRQTNSAGMSNPGLTSSIFAPVAVPGYDRPAHKAALQNPSTDPNAAGYAPNAAPIRCSGGAANWPANSKISGNVSIANNCEVTLNGNVWITGNLTFGNNAKIRIAEGAGVTVPVIMLDGSTGLDTGNNSLFIPNSFGTGAEVVSVWWNTNLATNGGFDCGGIIDKFECTNVTGLALSSSQSTTTIELSNNTNAENTVFRTLWSRAEISNNGALGAVAGQTILMKQNAVINFTASIAGSDNLTVTWVKKGYLRVFQ
jgi:hypothetical protein